MSSFEWDLDFRCLFAVGVPVLRPGSHMDQHLRRAYRARSRWFLLCDQQTERSQVLTEPEQVPNGEVIKFIPINLCDRLARLHREIGCTNGTVLKCK